MTRRELFYQAGAPALLQRTRRPNIVFILADDLRYDTFGITGHPFAKTPGIDRVGREGAVFQNFFCTTPLCSPSRASFLTGLYARNHRIVNNDNHGIDYISHTLVSFPRVLREAGYQTGFIGKWHMGADDSRRPGFDRWISFKGQGLYIDPVVNEDGNQRQLTGYMTDYLNQQALAFVRQPRTQPFCLYLSHKAVHFPYLPAKRHESLYSDVRYTPPAPVAGDLEGKPVISKRKTPPVDRLALEGATAEPAEPRRGRPTDPDSVYRDQLRCLASVDEGVGEVLDALKRSGQLDDTIVIFTGDNGYLMGEHGQFDMKRYAYEESLRIPFFLRYPRLVKPGTKLQQMGLSIDVMPTLLELAGASWPGKFDGQSLAPILRDNSTPGRDSFAAEYFEERTGRRVPSWQAARSREWKYIHYPENPAMNEIYNLTSDPQEINNRIGDPAARDSTVVLRDRMRVP